MIDKNQILSFNHYKRGKAYTGSYQGMRYRIVLEKAENEDDTNKFRVDTWPEPFCYEVTPDEQKTVIRFPFSENGYEDVLKYLNEIHANYVGESS